ncbi:MAG: PAS domain S-box protein [Bacteroidota bacterium]
MDNQCRNIFNALDNSALVSVTDIKGIINFVNPKFCEISGYSADELIGRNHRILKSGLHRHDFYDNMWRTISGGKVWEGSIWNRAKNGSFYCVQTTITPMRDENCNIEEYISIRHDITFQKNQENLLKEALDNLKIQDPDRTKKLVSKLENIRNKYKD